MKYTVTGKSVTIGGGVLELSPAQAGDRTHLLKNLKGGKYEVLSPVVFKLGEQFGYDGDLPKSVVAELQPEDDKSKKANQKAAEKAAKEAAEKAAKEAAEKEAAEKAAKEAAEKEAAEKEAAEKAKGNK